MGLRRALIIVSSALSLYGCECTDTLLSCPEGYVPVCDECVLGRPHDAGPLPDARGGLDAVSTDG